MGKWDQFFASLDKIIYLDVLANYSKVEEMRTSATKFYPQ